MLASFLVQTCMIKAAGGGVQFGYRNGFGF